MSQADPLYPDAQPQTFQRGMEFQDFVCEELAREHIILQNLVSKRYQYEVGESLQGFEIKLDRAKMKRDGKIDSFEVGPVVG